MTLENLVGKGLRKESARREEIQRLLAKAQTRLTDASSEAISRDSRFDGSVLDVDMDSHKPLIFWT